MDDIKDSQTSTSCKANMCGIAGVVLLVLATILTLVTLSGLGIIGMFFVGLMLACHKKMGCCGWGCRCKCCCSPNHGMSCDVVDHDASHHNNKHDVL